MNEQDRAALEPVSKSQRKRDAQALQKLGAELVGLAPAELEKLDLSEPLAQAIGEARTLSRGALKRQLKYIGRLLRETEAETVGAALARIQETKRRANAEFHRLERWRDRLLAEGDSALQEFLTQFPEADRSHLRQLVRNARKEKAQDRPLRATRALFRYVRALAEK